jgi:hypothetical protein
MDLESPVNISAQNQGHVELAAQLNGGRLRITDPQNNISVDLEAGLNAAVLALGGSGFDGNIIVKNAAGKTTIFVSGRNQEITLSNEAGEATVIVSGQNGDISLTGADAAEEFEVTGDISRLEVGTVMVIDIDGKLRESSYAYDRGVAGVISGGGGHRPGLILGRNQGSGPHLAIALAGKVYCKADATETPIEVGGLLTSAPTPGHAMQARDQTRAFGSVIGKALQSLQTGRSLIPVLVALQ